MSNNKQDSGVRYIGKRHPDWPVDEKKFFSEQQNKLANKIVDKDYKNTKNKPAFTQIAENARELLGYKYNSVTGKFANNDDEVSSASEAVKVNDALEKNFQDHKQHDYLNKLKRFGVEESQVKHAGYPKHAPKTKLANMPIVNRNINNLKATPTKTNPTIERYKQFKEEKKFNEDFEREYGDKAIEKYVRSKVYENKKAGKADYEDLPSSYLIVGEAAKDKAAKKLKVLQESQKRFPKTESSLNNFISYKEALLREPIKRAPSLDEWMAAKAPTNDPDLDAGIAGLDGLKNFKDTVDLADQKFPKTYKGIGPFLTGEDD